MKTLPQIVIVGGGAGGLELATRLGKKLGSKKKAQITLVDASPIHLWKPLLHEVAAGTLNSYEDELNYLAYASNHYFQFCLGKMQGIHRNKKEIVLSPIKDNNQIIIPERTLAYDVLVIAVGSISNNFNIPGVSEHCLVIDNAEQALSFQRHLIKTIMAFAHKSSNEVLSIAIAGAGATGVELAAELHYAIRQMATYGFDFKPQQVSISLIEASNRILPALTEDLSIRVEKQLEGLGIKIYKNEVVEKVTADGFHTKSGQFIPAIIKTWAAGIRAPEFLNTLDGLTVNRLNQLVVKPTLQTTIDDDIFALGDCAYCLQKNSDKPVPPRAQAAHQQASFLAKAIPLYLQQQALPSYYYHDYGSLISLSYYETIGNLMGKVTKSMMIEGRLARFAYLSLYRAHQITLYGFWRITLLLLANSLTRKIRPRLKLH